MVGKTNEIEHRVGVAKRLATNIRAYLGELTLDQWELPSACSEWRVRDVVSHLIGGAERQAESMERGRRGDSNPPAGFSVLDAAELSAINAQRDIDRSIQLEGHSLESFDESYGKLTKNSTNTMGTLGIYWHGTPGVVQCQRQHTLNCGFKNWLFTTTTYDHHSNRTLG